MPKGRIETRGSILLGGSVALAAAGLLLVDGVLMALGTAAAILFIICWILGWMNLRKLEIGLEMPKVAQAGVPVRIGVTVSNGRKILDAFGLELEIAMPGGLDAGYQVPWIPAGAGAAADLREVLGGRGFGKVIEGQIVSRFPLGLFRFHHEYEIVHSLLVLPHPIEPRELVSIGSAFDAMPLRAAAISEAVGEPRGLREYRAGDSSKVIAWPASLRSRARGGGLMVRELDPPGLHSRQAVIMFHSFATDGSLIRPDRFERAISLVWGAMRYFSAGGIPVVLIADFEEWVPRRVVTRRQLGRAGEVLARASRMGGTEEHELMGRLQDLDRDEALVMISDMPAGGWKDQVGRRPGLVVIDVAAYERRNPARRRDA